MCAWQVGHLLRMMKVNKEIFGDEILEIEGASQSWCIKYFEKRLFDLLPWEVCVNSPFVNVLISHGDISAMTYKGGFNLTEKQCIEITNYIYGKYMRDSFGKTKLHWVDARVILNYIYHKMPLSHLSYRLVYTADKNIPLGWREDSSINLIISE